MALLKWLGLEWRRPISVAFVGLPSAEGERLADIWTPGKITFDYFFPPFARTLAKYSIDVRAFRHSEFRAKRRRGEIAILVYSEGQAYRHKELIRHIRTTQAFAQRSGFRVVHPLETGQILIDKTRTNRLLAAAVIPVPTLISDAKTSSRVFSNANFGTQRPVFVYEPGIPLDPKRHNTEFIDTTFRYAGNDYYVVLRAMCVGGACYSIFPRVRPVADGCASVHNKDTPLNAALLKTVYAEVVLPRREKILEICERLGQVLGLGFYAHDILPAAGSNRVFVCESGFKFDDRSARQHMAPLRGQLTTDDFLTDEVPVKAAHAFALEFRRTTEYFDPLQNQGSANSY